ncbi:ABT1/Esf2 like protein [Aduncisulcus paluster]|uniref:ABT1/Esf2 like protein n=1 Tax=Aduncisulcus paluster TaxID=2918883 RepID=A0ABQ5K6T7_9EUKA|nr:ABT1/Esf2 like protein [Aduncisulcus paluster]|eukprot:gnl/Carplike_NY0171/3515_a4746_422.p1 GENE.gnl/Carplike_NY0171/3515_a4746_422~~gnl/Carplike_NY0171/3515_a4746_422.p1  ORF type:complete len:210 (+),score=39.68 gnl/Carplike_NY0171/3515_a4746_422:54-683(+)
MERGIVKLVQVPLGLDPELCRQFISKHTKVFRIHFKRRKVSDGVRSMKRKHTILRFECGWFEVESFDEANRLVKMLNGTPITKKKCELAKSNWSLVVSDKDTDWEDIEVSESYEKVLRARKLKKSLSKAKEKQIRVKDRVLKDQARHYIVRRKEKKEAARKQQEGKGIGKIGKYGDSFQTVVGISSFASKSQKKSKSRCIDKEIFNSIF